MSDQYTIKVTFTRELGDDLHLLEERRKADPKLSWRWAAITQFGEELQEAYASCGLGGHFKVDSCDLLYGEDKVADEQFGEQFPEVTRWSEVADDARTILEFLDWAREGEGLQDVCDGNMSPQKLVYEFFEINEYELENDRHRLYETLRKNPWPVLVVEKKEG